MAIPFSIPNYKQPLLHANTNIPTREWYRFFDSLFGATGSGQIDLSSIPGQLGGAQTLSVLALQKPNPAGKIADLQNRIAALEAIVYSRVR